MSIKKFGFCAIALLGATTSFAAPPANVRGIWMLLVNQEYETLDIVQGGPGLGPCPPISGKIGVATVRGFYCPDTGRIYFHHSNIATDVTVRTFYGVVADAVNGFPMHIAGKMTVVNTNFEPHGDYPFSGSM